MTVVKDAIRFGILGYIFFMIIYYIKNSELPGITTLNFGPFFSTVIPGNEKKRNGELLEEIKKIIDEKKNCEKN